MEQRKPLHKLLEAIKKLKPINESQKVTLDAVVSMITETDYYGDLKTLLQIEKEQTNNLK